MLDDLVDAIADFAVAVSCVLKQIAGWLVAAWRWVAKPRG